MREGGAQPAPQRVGVLGGTFDPVHLGHLIIAQEVAHRLGLDRVLLVPARVSPFKQDAHAAPAEDRAAMIEAAVRGAPRLLLSRIDLDRPAPSYTADTLRLLSEELGDAATIHFIMGADALATFAEWRGPDEILRLARLTCVTRPGAAVDLQALEAALPGAAERIDMVDDVAVGISSTDIRRRVAQGAPIRFLVPRDVERYIVRHGLYRSPQRTLPNHTCY